VEALFYKCAKLLRQWMVLCKEDAEKLERWATELEVRSARPPRLTWVQGLAFSVSEVPVQLHVHSVGEVVGENDTESVLPVMSFTSEHLEQIGDRGFDPAVSAIHVNAASE
jgi:hypothetical protein